MKATDSLVDWAVMIVVVGALAGGLGLAIFHLLA